MYGTTKARAEELCAIANEALKNGWHPRNLECDRVIDRIEVRPHSWHPHHHMSLNPAPRTWGLVPHWAYYDRPDLDTTFSGPFIRLQEIL